MLSRLASKKNARVNAGQCPHHLSAWPKLSFSHNPAAESSAAANASTAQASQPSTSGSTSPMRTRSGKRLVAPIAEGMKAVKAKLGAGRRGKKTPAEEPAVAGPSTSVQAVAEYV